MDFKIRIESIFCINVKQAEWNKKGKFSI